MVSKKIEVEEFLRDSSIFSYLTSEEEIVYHRICKYCKQKNYEDSHAKTEDRLAGYQDLFH